MQLHVFPLYYFTLRTKLTGQRFVSSLHELGLKTDDFNPIIDKWFHLLCIAWGYDIQCISPCIDVSVIFLHTLHIIWYLFHFENEIIKYVKLKRFHFVCVFFFKNLIPYSSHVFECAANTVSFTRNNTSVHWDTNNTNKWIKSNIYNNCIF